MVLKVFIGQMARFGAAMTDPSRNAFDGRGRRAVIGGPSQRSDRCAVHLFRLLSAVLLLLATELPAAADTFREKVNAAVDAGKLAEAIVYARFAGAAGALDSDSSANPAIGRILASAEPVDQALARADYEAGRIALLALGAQLDAETSAPGGGAGEAVIARAEKSRRLAHLVGPIDVGMDPTRSTADLAVLKFTILTIIDPAAAQRDIYFQSPELARLRRLQGAVLDYKLKVFTAKPPGRLDTMQVQRALALAHLDQRSVAVPLALQVTNDLLSQSHIQLHREQILARLSKYRIFDPLAPPQMIGAIWDALPGFRAATTPLVASDVPLAIKQLCAVYERTMESEFEFACSQTWLRVYRLFSEGGKDTERELASSARLVFGAYTDAIIMDHKLGLFAARDALVAKLPALADWVVAYMSVKDMRFLCPYLEKATTADIERQCSLPLGQAYMRSPQAANPEAELRGESDLRIGVGEGLLEENRTAEAVAILDDVAGDERRLIISRVDALLAQLLDVLAKREAGGALLRRMEMLIDETPRTSKADEDGTFREQAQDKLLLAKALVFAACVEPADCAADKKASIERLARLLARRKDYGISTETVLAVVPVLADAGAVDLASEIINLDKNHRSSKDLGMWQQAFTAWLEAYVSVRRGDADKALHAARRSETYELAFERVPDRLETFDDSRPNVDPFRSRSAQLFLAAAWLKMSDPRITPDERKKLSEEAFLRAQRIHDPAAAAALRLRQSRGAATRAGLADLAQQRDDLVEQLLLESDPKRGAALRQSLLTVEGAIARRAPGYSVLISPQDISAERLQSGLREGEALSLVVEDGANAYVFAVDRSDVAWTKASMPGQSFGDAIADLRKGLCGETCTGDPVAFDAVLANRLYMALFGSAAVTAIVERSETLYVVPTGSFSSLPFSVLVSSPPVDAGNDPASLRKLRWLGLDKAVATVPSVAAAVSSPSQLQQDPSPASGYVGIAPFYGRPQTSPTAVGALLSQYGSVPAATLNAMPPLSGAEEEISRLAELFDGRSRLLMDVDATETHLKELASNGGLSSLQVLAFGAHGLVSGDFSGAIVEPAIVLHAPDQATVVDDGLLMASEIADLRIDASWVILGACNTASGETPGGEGLSGLARAFLLAGSRAILVSHWPLDDQAAPFLSSKAVEIWRTGVSPPKALQRSMQHMFNDESRDGQALSNAHPAIWSSYALVWMRSE